MDTKGSKQDKLGMIAFGKVKALEKRVSEIEDKLSRATPTEEVWNNREPV